MQEVPGPGPPVLSHFTLKLKLSVKFLNIPLFFRCNLCKCSSPGLAS